MQATYTVAKFAEYVCKAVELYQLESAVFVGSGFGAKILAAAAGSLSRARGFVFVGTDSPSPADPRSYVIAGTAAPAWLSKTIATSDGRCVLAVREPFLSRFASPAALINLDFWVLIWTTCVWPFDGPFK
jgi:hypothetical protein